MTAQKQPHDYQDALKNYFEALNGLRRIGKPTEHTYRSALAVLLGALLPDLTPSNEQGRMPCGAPDIVLFRHRDNIPIAYVETKDIGDPDLDGRKGNKEQFDRYKSALRSIVFTDYLDFVFCRDGQTIDRVRIAEAKGEKIVPTKDQFEKFVGLVTAFGNAAPQTIASPATLAQVMANKARLMATVFEESISKENGDSMLTGQMEAFKSYLLHDITPRDFADIYAQTIAYGMFAARIHHASPETFGRNNAAELIPKTNPFLRNLFDTIAGLNIQDGIVWIVDDLADVFQVTDIEAVLRGIGRSTQQADPLVHFYEDFLSAYDPALRKSRGVWYTPKPVVQFIVRAVDEILQTDFGLPKGLADNSKTRIRVQNAELDVHKVQILDPATGTGTFLAETVGKIHEKYQGQAGAWQSYVEQHLLPRLNGFEILMAPYAMAHLKLDRVLAETGYAHKSSQRLRVYLTNSLEEHHPDTGTLFAQFLANESREANTVKRDTPVMVVMGNPPYSAESQNKGEWIARLMEDYKLEPGTSQRLDERNSKWINDDYVKFIRLGQHFIGRLKEGVAAYITNHSFLDNPTFRGMRYSLLKSFDKIYIIDLHGNAKKKEVAPDGGRDENVFDIQQGASIAIFVKLPGKKKNGQLAEVRHFDIFGKKEYKFDYLLTHALTDSLASEKFPSVPFADLRPARPEYFFVPKDYKGKKTYDKGFSVADLFSVNSTGIVTARDNFTIRESPESVEKTVKDFLSLGDEDAREKFALGKDVRDWTVAGARADLRASKGRIVKITYRPFDARYTHYSGVDCGFHCRPRYEVMRHFLHGENVALSLCRQFKTGDKYCHTLVSKNMIESGFVSNRTSEITYMFPLYLYSDQGSLTDARTPNLNPEIVEKISKGTGLEFEGEKTGKHDRFTPVDLLDYVYAVLHSPTYREKYREFLKTDFPRIPYPADASELRRLGKHGAELRALHIMEHSALNEVLHDYPFPVPGDNTVERPRWELLDTDKGLGRVWINADQYFDGIPLVSWEFCIGGYQPAQKWLKDRKGHVLTFEDIEHYQRIVKVLAMTDGIMWAIG